MNYQSIYGKVYLFIYVGRKELVHIEIIAGMKLFHEITQITTKFFKKIIKFFIHFLELSDENNFWKKISQVKEKYH